MEAVAVEGGAVHALARESAAADLTVVGARDGGGLTGAAFGSVGMRLAALTRGPLLVPPPVAAADESALLMPGPVTRAVLRYDVAPVPHDCRCAAGQGRMRVVSQVPSDGAR
ncbi:universal stress protein [Streptomyces turgidiscabies]|uniref:UspA domain-containing protein n=1 Tax=Streptomyces turgidiscabies TaxID=85558 RepID=A0ABU0RTV3_9ACTN|nr:hypothetical protein [Streptomyces turgidiscabies]